MKSWFWVLRKPQRKARVNALSPEDRKAHNRAVREARAIAKALREAGGVVAVAGEDNDPVGDNVDNSFREDEENEGGGDEIVDGDNDCESGGEDGIHRDFLDGLAMSSEI
jgi:hypothetical protein